MRARPRKPAPFLAEFDRLAAVVRLAELRRLAVLDRPALELDGQSPELELLERVGLAELVGLAVAGWASRRLAGLRRLAVAGWRLRAPVVIGVCLGVWAACLALLAGGWVAS